MARRDDLFDLIQTLTPNEKRYFKLQASLQSGEKEYLLVFDTMAKQKVYNDDAVQQVLKQHKVKTPLFRIKHYLYGQILRSLKAMDKHEKTELKLIDLAKETWILYSKKLPEQALKRAEKALTIARKESMRLHEAYFTEFKIEILSRREEGTPTDDEVRQMYAETREALQYAMTNYKYVELKKRMFILLRQEGTLSSPENKKRMEELYNDPYMQNEDLAQDFMARYNFYQAHFFYHVAKDDLQQAYEFCEKQVAWYDDNPEQKKLMHTNYIIALNNFISGALTMGETDKAGEMLHILESSSSKSQLGQVSQFTFIYHSRADILWRQKNYAKMLHFLQSTRAELEEQLPYINHFRLAGIKLLHSQALLFTNQPGLALDQSQEALELLGNQKYPRLVAIVKIHEVLIHFSLGNFKIIDHLIRSLSRQKQTAKCLHPYEKEMLNGLKKAALEADTNKRKNLLKELAKTIKAWNDKEPLPVEPGYNYQFPEWLQMMTA